MTKKEKITKGLIEIGACFASSKDRFVCTRHDCYCKRVEPIAGNKCYHIHPDASHPYEMDIVAFNSLDEIAAYVAARKEANAQNDASKSFEIMECYWRELL